MFGAHGKAMAGTCLSFVSHASLEAGGSLPARCERQFVAVKNTRAITKKDMVHNDATPDLQVDPETYSVTADGVKLTCEPAETLPMAQRYFLF